MAKEITPSTSETIVSMPMQLRKPVLMMFGKKSPKQFKRLLKKQ